jgi:hypothetical protein
VGCTFNGGDRAKEGFIGIKGKNKHAIEVVKSFCKDLPINVFILGGLLSSRR